MITLHEVQRSTFEDICQVDMNPPPNAGRMWQGIPHGVAVTEVEAAMDRIGCTWGPPTYSLARAGAQLTAVWRPCHVPGIQPPEGVELSLGLLHGNDRRRAVTIMVGGRVLVCSNGLVSSEIVLRRKHTVGLDLREEFDEAMRRYLEQVRHLPTFIGQMKERQMTTYTVDHTLMEAMRRGLLPSSYIRDVYREYTHPRFRDFAGESAWSLYNAYSWVIKKSSPHQQMDRLLGFANIIQLAL